MGKLIDATGIFRMRRLEADVERADNPKYWGMSITAMLGLAEKQRELTDIMEAYANDIILP